MNPAPRVCVVDGEGAAGIDAAAIASGIPSRALMQRAGAAAAAEIATRYRDLMMHGVAVATGAGNNGGDGWVIARALHDVGIRVRVVECDDARTADSRAERQMAIDVGVSVERDASGLLTGGELVVVDALLGTGFNPAKSLRADISEAIDHLVALRERPARIVGVDLPSGLDATTGASATGLVCDLTLTFGTAKRGHLLARDRCGTIVVLDIGLGAHASSGAHLLSAGWFREMVPPIPVSAHKGTRKKIAIVGGAAGMAGAVILAARAALRSGAGLVKCIVDEASIAAIQSAEPAALTTPWPATDADARNEIDGWADVVLVGPGLGRERAREITTRVLEMFRGPVVLDADALNAFENEVSAMALLTRKRQALLTPHPLEFARLSGLSLDVVNQRRFVAPIAFAAQHGVTVLLKGVPTVIASAAGEMIVCAEGSPVLATGGAGDVLGGIAAVMLAQTGDALTAGSLAAFAHGRAAAAVSLKGSRGFTLDDVLGMLPSVWSAAPPVPRPPVLAELPPLS